MSVYTEEEAKTKWCPFTRAAIDVVDGAHVIDFTSANRSERGLPAVTLCVASACMAWRWGEEPLEPALDPNKPPPPEYPREGYCGAFGAPRW